MMLPDSDDNWVAILSQVAQHANRVSSADQNPSLAASSTGPKSPAPAEMRRKSSSPRPSTDDFPMQCPIRKTQGKVRDGSLRCQLARPRYWTWYLILRCNVQWVLNLDCSCNGGKKKLQAPVHATRAGAVVKFTCTHTHCRSNHGGVCPHFQMCPHWYAAFSLKVHLSTPGHTACDGWLAVACVRVLVRAA